MAVAPAPGEIYARAIAEGRRRIDASALELLANGFNAGFTIVFGVALLGIVTALTTERLGPDLAEVAGAAAFAAGLVYLIVSRAELFTENFFDPVATLFAAPGRSTAVRILRLWCVILVMNLVGASVLVAIVGVDGVLPGAAEASLLRIASDIAGKPADAAIASAIVGGALVTLLSFLLQAVDTVLARIVVTLLVGFMLAVGPFAHVVVTAVHLLFGLFNGGSVTVSEAAVVVAAAAVGNVIGGIAFVSLTHIAQARAESSNRAST
jgi:formate-nitrite transporter family protein